MSYGRCCVTEPRSRTALQLDIFIEIPSVESLHDEHPQDHFHRRGAASELPGVWVTARKVRFDLLEEDVVIQQSIQLGQLRFELQLQLGHQLEEVHGIVAIDYHDGRASG